MKISFAKDGNWREAMCRGFVLRFSAKADFIQEQDCVADPLDDRFNGKYAYISALTREMYCNGADARLRCSFEGYGAPILMIVEDMELDAQGDAHYGNCIEAVIWKHGVNVWRYHLRDGQVHFVHAMADFTPLEEGKIHDLRIKVRDQMLQIEVDGKRSSVYIPDMPEKFWVGAALCEGVNRLYSLEVNEGVEFDDFLTWGVYTEPAQEFER